MAPISAIPPFNVTLYPGDEQFLQIRAAVRIMNRTLLSKSLFHHSSRKGKRRPVRSTTMDGPVELERRSSDYSVYVPIGGMRIMLSTNPVHKNGETLYNQLYVTPGQSVLIITPFGSDGDHHLISVKS